MCIRDRSESTSIAALPLLNRVPDPATDRATWTHWQEGLSVHFALLETLPPLRLLLILEHLAGHKSATFVCWLMGHGIMPLYTPISGSGLNRAESVQRILVNRALAGQRPDRPAQLIEWLDAVARGWNAHPTPFGWAGKRALRRQRARERHYIVSGSGAISCQPSNQGMDLNGDKHAI